jgi:hypothetical protein
MKLGYEVEAARVTDPSVYEDTPHQESMRAGQGVRRNPAKEDLKVRRDPRGKTAATELVPGQRNRPEPFTGTEEERLKNRATHHFVSSDPEEVSRCMWCDCRPWGTWADYACSMAPDNIIYRKSSKTADISTHWVPLRDDNVPGFKLHQTINGRSIEAWVVQEDGSGAGLLHPERVNGKWTASWGWADSSLNVIDHIGAFDTAEDAQWAAQNYLQGLAASAAKTAGQSYYGWEGEGEYTISPNAIGIHICPFCDQPFQNGDMVADQFVYKAGELSYIEQAHLACLDREGIPRTSETMTTQAQKTSPEAHEVVNATGSNPMNINRREADILEAMSKATLDEQAVLMNELDQLQAARRTAKAQERELDWGAVVAGDHLTPASTFERHTAATDWMDTVAPHATEDMEHRAAAEAAMWVSDRAEAVLYDVDEFTVQATGTAQTFASQYGEGAPTAAEAFVSEAVRLRNIKVGNSYELQGWDVNQTYTGPHQSGDAESDLPEELTPTDRPEEQDNFAPPVDPVNSGHSTIDGYHPGAPGAGEDPNSEKAVVSASWDQKINAIAIRVLDIPFDQLPPVDASAAKESGDEPTPKLLATLLDEAGHLDAADEAWRFVASFKSEAEEKDEQNGNADSSLPHEVKVTEATEPLDPITEDPNAGSNVTGEGEVNSPDGANDVANVPTPGQSEADYPQPKKTSGFGDSQGPDTSSDSGNTRDGGDKSGDTCAECGDSITKDPAGENPSTYHHNNGEKHDHEATPTAGGKTSALSESFNW